MPTTSEPTDNPLSLHSELRRLRQKENLTLAALSQKTKQSRQTLYHLERGDIPLDSRQVIDELDKFFNTGRHLYNLWKAAPQPRPGITVMGDNAVINSVSGDMAIGSVTTGPTPPEKQSPSFPEQRQKFHFDYLNRLLTHSTVMFWVSVVFMMLGGVIILTSGALITFRDGGQDVKLVTGLSGALITTAGGVLHRQARQKEARVAEEARVIAAKIDADDRFGQATAIIERVDNPKLKDQLKTTAALTQLGLNPDADEMAKRLLPMDENLEITAGPESNDER